MSAPPEVSVSDVISKILQIEKLAPRCAGDTITYRFMRYMASSQASYLRSSETLFPEIFLMVFTQALNDAANGENSFTGEPIPRTFAQLSPIMYALVKRDLPVIADAIFPPEFSAELKEIFASVNTELAALLTPPEKKRARRR